MISEQVSTSQNFRDKVDVPGVLHVTIVLEDEGVLNLLENDFLVVNVVDMLTLNDVGLLHALNGIHLFLVLLLPA